jgi:archaellum component FlaF (FlaF/FlaG flagellin family)
MRTVRYEGIGNMKSDTKIETVLAAILIVVTLISVGALVSAVQNANNGTIPAAANGTNGRN